MYLDYYLMYLCETQNHDSIYPMWTPPQRIVIHNLTQVLLTRLQELKNN